MIIPWATNTDKQCISVTSSSISDIFFDDLIAILINENGKTDFNKKYDGSGNIIALRAELASIEDIIRGACSVGAIKTRKLRIENDSLVVNLELIEPTCSYYWRFYTDLINNPKQTKSLEMLMKQPAIAPQQVYQCRLFLDGDEVFLVWNNGKHWLYDFGNKNQSTRRSIFQAIYDRTDTLLSKKELAEITGYNLDNINLKEQLTKMFLRKHLNKYFVISDYAPKIGYRIGVKSMTSITGTDLIMIIREQLNYSIGEKRKNKINKILQE